MYYTLSFPVKIKHNIKYSIRKKQHQGKLNEPPRSKLWSIKPQLGKLGNRFGEPAEHLLTPNITEKFRALNYAFTKAGEDARQCGDGAADSLSPCRFFIFRVKY
jgi:hypothetical protein